MKADDFDFISKFLKKRAGLVLTPDKSYLLESRLMPVSRAHGFKCVEELLAAMRLGDKQIELAVTEAMMTNESFFFRDIRPFDQFKEMVLPRLLEARKDKKSLRIWCAACSSGQEPYSLAMIFKEEVAKLSGWRLEIIGTDISTSILQKAKDGRYSQFEVQRGLPVQMLVKYFKKDGDFWSISQEIRSMVQYRQWNLLDDLKPLGQFDVVFCRNVLIYFDQPTKSDILSRVADVMASDAFLYLGGAETVLGVSNRFKPVSGQRGIYELGQGVALPGTESFAVNQPAAASAAAKVVLRPVVGARPVVSGGTTPPRPAVPGTAPAAKPTIAPRPTVAPGGAPAPAKPQPGIAPRPTVGVPPKPGS